MILMFVDVKKAHLNALCDEEEEQWVELLRNSVDMENTPDSDRGCTAWDKQRRGENTDTHESRFQAGTEEAERRQ